MRKILILSAIILFSCQDDKDMSNLFTFYAASAGTTGEPIPPPEPIPSMSQVDFQALIDATPDGGTFIAPTVEVEVSGLQLRIPAGKDIVCQGSPVIKRAATGTATLTSELTAGTAVFDVDDPSDFSVGDRTLVVDPTNPNFPQGPNLGSNCGWQSGQITDITGNTVTVAVNAITTMPVGSLLIHNHLLLWWNTTSNVEIDGWTFDGNVSENAYTYDWRYNTTLANVRPGVTIRNSHFKNTPSENIFQAGGLLEDNTIENLRGSFSHVSNAAPGGPLSTIRGTTGSGVSLSTQEENWHNEGFVVFSNNSQNVLIEDNNISNGGRASYGPFQNDDGPVTSQNNTWTNFAERVNYSKTSPNPIPINNIDLDTWVNTPAGSIALGTITIEDANPDVIVVNAVGELVKRTSIDNGDFIISGLNGVSVIGNTFFADRIELQLSSSVPQGSTGTLQYVQGTKHIISTDAATLLSFAATSVTNNVSGANQAPVIDNPVPDQSMALTTTYQIPINTASDPEGDTLHYDMTMADDSPLPPGWVFNAGTRTLTVPQMGSFDVKLIVADQPFT